MFYATRVKKRRRFICVNIYKQLWQDVSGRNLWPLVWKLLQATEALRFIDAACCIS